MGDGSQQRASEDAVGGATYRLQHPVRYSAAAAVLAGLISFPLDLLLFGHDFTHAMKVGISSSLTWFGVLLVMSYSQRVKVKSD